MGAGGREVTLDTFESHLKKLLHIIDKLPKVEREKAVLILRNSANHYSNLTSGHPLPPPPPCPPLIYNNILPCNQALSEIPVSQVAKTFDLLKDESLTKPCNVDLLVVPSKTESQAILEEIGGLADHDEAGPQDDFIEDGEDWDQHILHLENSENIAPTNNPGSAPQPTSAASHASPACDLPPTSGCMSSLTIATAPAQPNLACDSSNSCSPPAASTSSPGLAFSATASLLSNSSSSQVQVPASSSSGCPVSSASSVPSSTSCNVSSLKAPALTSQMILCHPPGLGMLTPLPLASCVPTTAIFSSSIGTSAVSSSSVLSSSVVSGPTNSNQVVTSVPLSTPSLLNTAASASNPAQQHHIPQQHQQHHPPSLGQQVASATSSSQDTPPFLNQFTTLPQVDKSTQPISQLYTVPLCQEAGGGGGDPAAAAGLAAEAKAGDATSGKGDAGQAVVNQTTQNARNEAILRCTMCSKGLEISGEMSSMSCSCRAQVCGPDCLGAHRKLSSCSGAMSKGGKVKKKREYRCQACNKFFQTSLTLKTHMEGHANNDCDKCPTKCATRRLLVAHMKQVHNINMAEKYYKCKFCTRKFSKKPSLWFHYTSHTVGSQTVCLKCGQIVESKEALAKHQDEHKETQFTCHRCGDFFARRQQYNAHLKQHDNYRCKLCTSTFSSKKRLKLHKNKEHGEGAKQPNDAPAVQGIKEEPIVSKNWKKSFRCGFCSFENSNYKKVVRHEHKHKNFRKFVCELCGSAFNSEHNLKEHTIYVHMDERNFKCNKCDKSFKARNALMRHEQVHNDRRLFTCPCGKSYKRQSHLNRHFSATSHGYTGAAAANAAAAAGNDISTISRQDLVAKAKFQDNIEAQQAWSQQETQNSLARLAAVDSQTRSCKSEVESIIQDVDSATIPIPSDKQSIKDFRKYIHPEKSGDYEKIWHYKIPKRFHSPQKYAYYPEKSSSRAGHLDGNIESVRSDVSRPGNAVQAVSSSKYPYDSLRNQFASQYTSSRHYHQASGTADRMGGGGSDGGTGLDRHAQVFQDKFHGDPYSSKSQDVDREFVERYPVGQDKLEYSQSQLPPERSYTDFGQDKGCILPEDLDDRQAYHCDDKSYGIADVIEDRQTDDPDKHFLQVDDRLFQGSSGRDPNLNPCLDPRMLGGIQDFRHLASFPDSGPADLTITSRDVTRTDTRSNEYFGGTSGAGHGGSLARHSYSKSRALSPVSSGPRNYPEPGRASYMPSSSSRGQPDMYRSTDLARPHHEARSASSNQASAAVAVEGLEEPSYRPLQDLGYPRQQNHYLDPIDPYVLLSRSAAELDEGYEKRHKFYRSEKYGRQDELNLRQEGGLLPPLLALTSSLPAQGHASTAGVSPNNIKMDYICSPSENMASHYNISDGNLDYY